MASPILPKGTGTDEVGPSRGFPVPLEGRLHDDPSRPCISVRPGGSGLAELLHQSGQVIGIPYFRDPVHEVHKPLDRSAVLTDGAIQCTRPLEVVYVLR